MSEYEPLGKARLDLEANTGRFEANIKGAERTTEGLENSLDALAIVAEIAEHALGGVRMGPKQATESRVTASQILEGVQGITDESRLAAHELDRVKLTERQALESELAADRMKHDINDLGDEADKTKRKLLELKLINLKGTGRTGFGVGPFGSGYGRIGLVGTAVGAGAILGPAAGPAALGLLAAIPTLATGAAGAIGTLALAFQGMGKAINGDKKAYDSLTRSQQEMVQTVRSLHGWYSKLKQQAAEGVLPGLTSGLKSALSPGTTGAISRAINEFATAIGHAGEQWGKYFGSKQFQGIFGPLMQSGARNLGVLSDAALHLFDAIGVLSRAAIPLTNWLTDMIDKGSRLFDTWTRGQEATGGLARGMNEAKSSLQLVWRLFVSLVKVVYELGAALYPVSKVAVKDLTNGLTALAGIIHRNRAAIQTVVRAMLEGLVGAVKLVAGAFRLLNKGLSYIVGEKSNIVTAFVAIGAAITIALGPTSAAIVGAVIAVGLIIQHWSTVKTWFINFSRFLGNLMTGLWEGIQGVFELGVAHLLGALVPLIKGLKAGLGWIPGIGPKIKHALSDVLLFVDTWKTKGRAHMAAAGADWGNAWGDAFDGAVSQALLKASAQGNALHHPDRDGASTAVTKPPKPKPPKPGTHEWYMQNYGFDPTQDTGDGSVFGTVPPFTKNTGAGTPAVVPPAATRAEQLASQNASKAAALHNIGKTASRYLNNEIADLNQAIRIIRDKLETATGKARTQLLAAITRDQNRITHARALLKTALSRDKLASLKLAVETAKLAIANAKEGTPAYRKAVSEEEKALRAEIAYLDARRRNTKLSLSEREKAASMELTAKKALARLTGGTGLNDTLARLQLAVETAKLAVENAQQGSDAWRNAMHAEEKALKSEIAYLDRRQKNTALSAKERTKALKQEIAAKKTLEGLLKQLGSTPSDLQKNEKQFLDSFARIVGQFAPNAFPKQPNPKTDTHLYDLVQETRTSNGHLRDLASRAAFPQSGYGVAAAGAVGG